MVQHPRALHLSVGAIGIQSPVCSVQLGKGVKYGLPHPDLICKVVIVTESAPHLSDCLPILKIQVI